MARFTNRIKSKYRKCIFCRKPLDNSDEHIIPSCINGRLHSRLLVCNECNTKKFGAILDPAVKELFNPILLTLGLENANSVHATDPEGKRFLYSKKGKVSPVKPESTEINKNGKTYIKVSGDKKNALNLYEKRATELIKKEYKNLSYDIKEIQEPAPPLCIECKFEITQEIILELNKIAIEFYTYSGLDLSRVKHLSERVNMLDKELSNIIFCNCNGEVRNTKSKEISHLIVLRTNNKGTLYCYIELFNVLCAYITLFEKCEEKIDCFYYQDAKTGQRFADEIVLNLEDEPINTNNTEDFTILTNELFYRVKEREFFELYNEVLTDEINKAKKEVESGTLAEERLTETCIKRCCEAIAYLTVYEFPYMIEDFKDEENPDINYIHSNLGEEQFEEFCETHKSFIGKNVSYPDGEVYVFDSFLKTPFLKINKIMLVKVFCVLKNPETNHTKYIPYRFFFDGISINEHTPS